MSTDPLSYWPAPPPSPPRRRDRVSVALRVVTALNLLVLAVSATAVVLRGPDEDGPPSIDAVVPELSEFVEEQRGLRFRRPVEVTLLDDAAFRARLQAEDDAPETAGSSALDAGATLQALGLVGPGFDLDGAIEQLTGASVAGFYDPEGDELVVRGDAATPLVRAVLVHELTHALQDQHFDLHRPDLRARDDESHLGFLGLVEGDANVVEEEYRDAMSDDDREQLAAEEARLYGGAAVGTPEVLVALLGFPYQVGPEFVRAVRRERGQAGLDAAYERPPASSEHLLHPQAYLDSDDPVAVPAPRARGRVVDRGVLGELGLLLTLGLAGDRALGAAVDDVDGWGGDRYVSWRAGAVACTAATVVMDDEESAGELRDALRSWAADRGRTSVGGSGRQVTLDACA